MQRQTPDYFSRFHCLADRCPHSCCVGWEVVIDPDTAAYYRTVPGNLGRRLREALRQVEGETCFFLEGRRCPFLNARGLCDIHQKLGKAHTSATCRSHPRFCEEYGTVQEISLSASCPAVRDLLLSSQDPLTFPMTRDSGEAGSAAGKPGNRGPGEYHGGGADILSEPPADEWLAPLRLCRERALAILCHRSLPLRRRMVWYLLFANEVQAQWDSGNVGELATLCQGYMEIPETLPPEVAQLRGDGIFSEALKILEGLDILEPDWQPLLRRAKEVSGVIPQPEWAGERILCYFTFRYWLKALSDGDLLSKAELAVFSWLVIERLAFVTGLGEALRRYCREIEHCAENMQALQEAFCRETGLSLGSFLTELGKG